MAPKWFLRLGVVISLVAPLVGGVPGAAAAPEALGAAGAFAVLAGSGITNTGLTVVNGDLGSCPTVAVTGFPPGVVNGTLHDGGAACAAKGDLATAYNATVALAPTTTYLGPTDLGGWTLTPGVYKSPTSLGIGGTLTLDAQGDPDATFTFLAGTTVITGSASIVALVNGAQACNVTWQVGSSATLGVASSFVGTMLVHTSITVNGGAVVQGRLLALGGAVTLDTNAVTRPQCAAAGSLSLAQAPTAGTALVEGAAVALPVTTVTDTRSGTTRHWTVTVSASDLVASGGATIPGADVTIAQSGTFTTGSGTLVAGGLVSVTADTVGSVYTFTPTAELAPQSGILAGSYAGTVTQTVV